MIFARRKIQILFTDGFRAAPTTMPVATALTLCAAITQITYPVGIRVMADAVVRHDVSGEVAGILTVTVLLTMSWALLIAAAAQSSELTERVKGWISARIARLTNAVPGLEHFERPDYMTELDLLDQRLPQLAAGPAQGLALASIAVRGLGAAVLLGLVFWPLALLPLAGLPPHLADKRASAIRQRADRRVAGQQRQARELFELASAAASAKELRTYGLGPGLRARHDHLTTSARHTVIRAATHAGLCSGLGWLVYAGAFAAAIAAIAIRAADGLATPGQLLLAISLLRRAQITVSQAASAISQLADTATAAQSMIWLEDHAAAAAGGIAPVPESLARGITVENVSFSYPRAPESVLRDINLRLPASSVIAIVGENGAGKSTLVRLLTGLCVPTQGRILVDGTDLAAMDPAAWRARTAAAFQDHVPWELRAGQTVGIGDLPRLYDHDAVHAALSRAAAAEVIDDLPGGLDTPLGGTFTNGRELSGGQRQKLALGRAMMRDQPLLLILDEPAAHLDAPTEDALFTRYLRAGRRASAASGAITIVTTHRFSTVRMADLIIVLDRGSVREIGNHQTLLAAGGLYAELFELQARGYR